MLFPRINAFMGEIIDKNMSDNCENMATIFIGGNKFQGTIISNHVPELLTNPILVLFKSLPHWIPYAYYITYGTQITWVRYM